MQSYQEQFSDNGYVNEGALKNYLEGIFQNWKLLQNLKAIN